MEAEKALSGTGRRGSCSKEYKFLVRKNRLCNRIQEKKPHIFSYFCTLQYTTLFVVVTAGTMTTGVVVEGTVVSTSSSVVVVAG